LLADGRVSRVVIAASDPSPYASGRGEEQLRGAGVTVDTGILADEAAELYEDYYPGP
jgi:diaminohydroxyphosphoribosylaminopyrimidine deaminase / 5-amino-6-(5-phosphoribosylamino)uracil reductase